MIGLGCSGSCRWWCSGSGSRGMGSPSSASRRGAARLYGPLVRFAWPGWRSTGSLPKRRCSPRQRIGAAAGSFAPVAGCSCADTRWRLPALAGNRIET